MTDQDVFVEVTGMGDLSDSERIITKSKGKLYTKGSGRYLVYYVADENNPKILIRHLLKLSGSTLSVSRTHPTDDGLSSKFVLKTGEKTDSEYNTPFGCLKLTFHTQTLCVSEDDKSIKIKAGYKILMNNETVSKNRLEISIMSQEQTAL